MADSKITALTSIGASTDPANDPLVLVDVSDTSMAATGTTKKVTLNQLLGAGGTATLASATITGDLTVRTNVISATSSGVGFGINTAAAAIDVVSSFQWRSNTGGTDKLAIFSGGAGLIYLGSTTASALSFLYNGSEAMRLNSTGLGVGTSPSYKIHSAVTSGFAGAFRSSTAVAGGILCGNSLADLIVGVDASGNGRLTADTSKYLGLGSGGINDRVILDSSGQVGIGVTPSAWSSGLRAINFSTNGVLYANGGNSAFFGNNYYNDSGGTNRYLTNNVATAYGQVSGAHQWFTAPSGTAGNAATFTQAMTLDASGILVVGNTAAASVGVTGGWLASPNSGNSYELIGHNSGSASGSVYSYFFYNSSQIGSITQNGTTGVLYNTTSDYRLKESVQPIANGLARVNALKPSIYKWKVDGSNGEGFIAHELAEVVPFAVSGEKDAVNEDGSIKPQGVDLSKVVPILVAAIQELAARVQTLETR